MKNSFYSILTFVFLCLAGGYLQAQKVGYTNVEYLLANMPEAAKSQTEVETFSRTLEHRLETKQAYLDAKLEEYNELKAGNRLSPESDAIAIKELEKLDGEVNASYEDAQRQILAKQQEIMNPILEKIQTAINAVAKEGGYTYILNQTSGSNILYGVETLEVSKEIAAKLGITLPVTKKP